MTHTMKDGAPAVTIANKKFGPVEFRLWSATKGTAYFDAFTLRGVEYKGRIAFEDQTRQYEAPTNCKLGATHGQHRDGSPLCDKAHFERVGYDYNNSYFKREVQTPYGFTQSAEPTDATRREVWAFVLEHAAKLFEDAELVKAAHVAEVGRMLERENAEIDALADKIETMRARYKERWRQFNDAAPFCMHKYREYDSESCTLPKWHEGAHDYGKR